jgi:predicted RNase H-like HicB family nuclease
MFEYHGAYYEIEDGWYLVKVLDFPGVISQGRTLRSTRVMTRDTLQTMAAWHMEQGQPLPKPNALARGKKTAFQETIPLKAGTCGSP